MYAYKYQMTYIRLKPFWFCLFPTKCKTTEGSHFPQHSVSHTKSQAHQCALCAHIIISTTFEAGAHIA